MGGAKQDGGAIPTLPASFRPFRRHFDPSGVISTLPASFRAQREIGPPVRLRTMFVYILASKTKRLYVGVTNDLARRCWEHRAEAVPGFTKKYGIKRLVYYEQIKSPETAIRREKQVKDYARVKKLALIHSLNPQWDDLARHWFAEVKPAISRYARNDNPSPTVIVSPSSSVDE